MNKKKFSTKFLVEMALLVAIILIMAFTPLGYIKTAGIEITLIVVPVAVRFFVGCDRTFRCVMKYISGHMQ